MITYDIKDLIAKAHFDYVGPAFPAWWKKNKTKFIYPNLKSIHRELGNGGRYFISLKLADKKGKQYVLPNEPLISIGLVKTIVETGTVGKDRKGTVKEYINTEDYKIKIEGACVNETDWNIYPTEQVTELKKMFEINEALEVVSNPFLELFDIERIVLKDIAFESMEGKEGVQSFTINAVSDQDFFAEINERVLESDMKSNTNYSRLI